MAFGEATFDDVAFGEAEFEDAAFGRYSRKQHSGIQGSSITVIKALILTLFKNSLEAYHESEVLPLAPLW